MSEPPDPHPTGDHAAQVQQAHRWFCESVPHNRALGLRLVDVGPASATVELPWAAHLVGDPDTGVLHGGAITALLDATCGACVFLRVLQPIPVATLDLRIDYLRPAEPGRTVTARAECYHLTRNVAFVRALAFHEPEARPIASAAGTFMLRTSGHSIARSAGPAAGAAS